VNRTDQLSLSATRRRSDEIEVELAAKPEQFRVLTGDRPTGPLHVGHLFGTLLNRVRLQDAGADVMVVIADYQTLTDRDAPDSLPVDVLNLVADYLAVGLDPSRCTIFAHSQVPALNQLFVPFLSLVTVAELRRNPTVKAEFDASDRATMNALMLTYPVHQAADLLFCHSNLVPVGKDQLPHLELSRAIARRFNDRYSPHQPYFTMPEGLLSDAPLLLGTDGQKMSKSRKNAIALGATEDETARLIRGAKTDSERMITYEPDRRPEVANLVLLASLCSGLRPEQIVHDVGTGGSAHLKQMVVDAINEYLRPIRSRRQSLVGEPDHLRKILADGMEQANAIGDRTLGEVRRLTHTVYSFAA
jgi:tryptophanyl-tRNA synthetase